MHLEAAPSALHGMGVFARSPIRKGGIIEEAPLILIPAADEQRVIHSPLFHHYFRIDDPGYPIAIGLGFSSIYNHAAPANAAYSIDLHRRSIVLRACRKIHPGEEVTINYHGRPDDPSPIHFPSAP